MDLSVLDNIPYFLDEFTRFTKKSPDDIMLVDDPALNGWTRKGVDILSGKIYNHLKEQGIGKGDFVLICLPRGVFPIITMIGVWKAGAAFVIVEDTYAPERIAYIAKDCGCKLTIDYSLFEDISQNGTYIPGYERADDHDACFAIYTSGSTGNPKGVLHEYGNIKLDCLLSNLGIKPGDRGALVAPLNFIAAIKSIFAAMYAPVTFYIIPYAVVKNPARLKSYFLQTEINVTFVSPSLIRAVGDDFGPYFTSIHTGSEPANDLYLEGYRLVNNYTMSEAGFTVCQFEIDKPYDTCPVGRPSNPILEIHLLDEEDNEVAQGEQGEICFENPFMREYINLPEQTAKALRGGLYHTGDLGYRNESGDVVLVGRANDMIKINGNRIEPAEIESAFKKVTGAKWCAAKGFEKPEQSYVCAYYTEDVAMDEADIRGAMEEIVPYYMIPSYFLKIDAVPLLPNGKLDRKSLPDPRASVERAAYVEPATEFQAKLCKAFEEVLGVEHVGATEDFYDLGGSSVKAMQILTLMGIDSLSAIDIYQGRTPEGIERIYLERSEGTENISEEDKEMRARQYPHEVPDVQRSVIDAQLFTPKAPMWIFPFLFSFGENADPDLVLEAGRAAIANHPIFSTVFEFSSDFNLQQRYDESVRQTLEIEHMTDEEFEVVRATQIPTMTLIGEPMVKMRCIKTDSNCYLMVIFHHVVMDGSSLQIVFSSVVRSYVGLPLELDTYYSYLEDEERARSTSAFHEAYEFYQRNYEGVDWCRGIVEDKAEPGNVNAQRVIACDLTPTNLKEMEAACGISANGFVNAVSLLTLAKTSGMSDVVTSFTFHNRADARRQHAGGLLARSLPLGVHFDRLETLADLYQELKAQTAENIAHSIYNWVNATENSYKNDIFAVVYETTAITSTDALDMIGAKMEPLDAHNEAALRRNMLQVFETATDITVLLSYMATIYSDACIDEFSSVFAGYANSLIGVKDPSSILIKDLLA